MSNYIFFNPVLFCLMLSTRKVDFGHGDIAMLNPATLKVLEDFLRDTITEL